VRPALRAFAEPKAQAPDPQNQVEEEAERKIHSQQLEIPSPTANSVGSVSPRKQKKLPPIVLETNSSHVRPKAPVPEQKKLPPIVMETRINCIGPQTLNHNLQNLMTSTAERRGGQQHPNPTPPNPNSNH
jgi:hypothetical protein